MKLEYKHIESLGCQDCPRFLPAAFDNQYEGDCKGPMCPLGKQIWGE